MPEPSEVSSQPQATANAPDSATPPKPTNYQKYGNYAAHHIYKLHTMPPQ